MNALESVEGLLIAKRLLAVSLVDEVEGRRWSALYLFSLPMISGSEGLLRLEAWVSGRVRSVGLAVPGHHLPRDPEIEREHRRPHENAVPDVPPELGGVFVAAQGWAASHRHDPGPHAKVGEQPERNDEALKGADEELKQELASEPPGRHSECDERDDSGPHHGRDSR